PPRATSRRSKTFSPQWRPKAKADKHSFTITEAFEPRFPDASSLHVVVDDRSGVTSTGDNFVQSQRGEYTWDMKLKRRLASFDVRHSFTTNFSYEIPRLSSLNGWTGVVVNGWQLNGILQMSSDIHSRLKSSGRLSRMRSETGTIFAPA